MDQIHSFLANYMDAACIPAGATGEWNGITGNSNGWQQIEIDLSAYAGQTVDLYISYITDWGTRGLGVFVDDIQITGSPLEDFEAGLGDWMVSVGPDSFAVRNWALTNADSGTFVEGPVLRSQDTVYLGFGFESIDTDANRNLLMNNVLQYLSP